VSYNGVFSLGPGVTLGHLMESSDGLVESAIQLWIWRP
jgi:hypothetical protein